MVPLFGAVIEAARAGCFPLRFFFLFRMLLLKLPELCFRQPDDFIHLVVGLVLRLIFLHDAQGLLHFTFVVEVHL